ncbi:MAG: ATP-binding protein [Candidatus Woesebacteria bacterium]
MQEGTTSELLIPLPVAILSGAAVIVSFISYILTPKNNQYWIAFANYALLLGSITLLVALTGVFQSPYLIVWMLTILLAGLFGRVFLRGLFLITNIALFLNLFIVQDKVTLDNLFLYILSVEAPIIVSGIIWYNRKQEKNKRQALNALTQQLSQVANKSEIVINAIAEGVIAIDPQGTIQLINPAAQKIIGWTKQDAIGLDYRSVLKLTDRSNKELIPETSPIHQVLMSNKPLANNDLSLTTMSGKKLLVSLVVSPVGNAEKATGAIIVFRDITREKEEERQKAEFISTASHEMRTPVAAIEGYLGLAMNPQTATIDDKARTFLEKAHDSTKHLGTLFQDLLTVSRAEDNRLIPHPTVVDITSFMRELTESLTKKAQDKGLFLQFKPGGGLQQTEDGSTKNLSPMYYSYVDSGHLREIANNLVDNAIKYTKEGNVIVDVKGNQNNITISVSDTGIGIPPEDISHMFQKFYRIDNSDTREIGGTGLGLYICRRLAEANNGHVWVESALGKGSTFYVQIPRISHERAAELEQQAQAQAASQSSTPTPGTKVEIPKPITNTTPPAIR